ncbi:MAG: serine/threonine-protein phosphatase [Anaerolineae bacterium]|nr:serine/threonine-protein phosphatase [Anaerolineae bacterium]
MPRGAVPDIGAVTHGGLRAFNQDAFRVATALPALLLAERGFLVVVADGLGSEGRGARAASQAADLVHQHYYADAFQDVTHSLLEAVRRTNADIYQQAQAEPDFSGMGTTITVACVQGEHCVIAHVGDSRAYLVREGVAHLLTQDHSWAAEEVRAGRLTREEAAQHPNRKHLSRSLGSGPQVQVDVLQEELMPGDVLLLCTDGLSNVVPEDAIAQAALKRLSAQTTARALLDLALQQGASDNVTVVVVNLNGRRAAIPLGPLALLGGALLVALFLVFFVLPRVLNGTTPDGGTPAGVAVSPPVEKPSEGNTQLSPTAPPQATGPSPTPPPTIPPISTPASTPTPVQAMEVSPTPEPTTPPATYPAPALIGPPDGAVFSGKLDVPRLSWRDVGALREDEYYVVKILFRPNDREVWHDYQWTRETNVEMPLYLLDAMKYDHKGTWSVTVYRKTGREVKWEPVEDSRSAVSESRTFEWK